MHKPCPNCLAHSDASFIRSESLTALWTVILTHSLPQLNSHPVDPEYYFRCSQTQVSLIVVPSVGVLQNYRIFRLGQEALHMSVSLRCEAVMLMSHACSLLQIRHKQPIICQTCQLIVVWMSVTGLPVTMQQQGILQLLAPQYAPSVAILT